MRKFSLGFRAMAGAARTGCGRENAVTCCMNSGVKFSLNRRKINTGFDGNRVAFSVDLLHALLASRAKLK
jgi:hypothetical protein